MNLKLSPNFRPELDSEVIEMLEDFCNAHHAANATEVVKKAVRDFIPRDLLVNQGVKLTFEALQSARKSPQGGPRSAGE